MMDKNMMSIKEFNEEFKRKIKEDDDKAIFDFKKSIDMKDFKKVFK